MSTEIPTSCLPKSSKWWRVCALKRCATLLSLVLAVAVLWGIIFDRWRPNDWRIPSYYYIDTLFYLSVIKHAENGDIPLLGYIHSDKVGAPFLGNLNDFPLAERPIFWAAGFISRIVGPLMTFNLVVIGAHVLAALSFYFAARLWGISRIWSWGMAIPYAFISYILVIGAASLGISFYGILPLQLYACWHLATIDKLSLQSPRFRLVLGIGIISGINQIYFILPFFHMGLFAIAMRLLTKRGEILRATTPFLLCGLVTTLTLMSHILYWAKNGMSGAMHRSYIDLEMTALKPIELVIPSAGQSLGIFDSIAEKYALSNISLGARGISYVGLLGILGLLILFFRFFQRWLSQRTPPLAALAVIWTLAYSSFGGLNSLFGLSTGFYFIRSTDRYCTAVATIALLYLSLVLNRLTRNWRALPRLGLVVILTAISLWDQALPSFRKHYGSADSISRKIDKDQELALKLEEILNPKSMLFILPTMDFPEAGPIHQLSDYQLIRPFLYTHDLRYSYGANKGRPHADWQHEVGGGSAVEMISKLETYGFSGILLNRLGYPDKGESILTELKNAGLSINLDHDKEWVLLRLAPTSTPSLPSNIFSFSRGWYGLEKSAEGDTWHWAGKSKKAYIPISSEASKVHTIKFTLGAFSARNVKIKFNGELLQTINFPASGEEEVSLVVELEKGMNTLLFSTDSPSRDPRNGDTRKLSFLVNNFTLSP